MDDTLLLVLVTLACGLFCWVVLLRPRSVLNKRPCYRVLHHGPDEDFIKGMPWCDYIVVGGGPGGLAACRRLLEKEGPTPTVVLIESGELSLPAGVVGHLRHRWNRARVLSLAPSLVPVPLDSVPRYASKPSDLLASQVTMAARPLRLQAITDRVKNIFLRFVPYPRGCAMGGCSTMDWGVELPSMWSTFMKHDRVQPTGRCMGLNPHSSLMGDSCPDALGVERQEKLPSSCSALPPRAVLNLPSYMDQDNRRLPIESYLLQELSPTAQSHLYVLPQHVATRLVIRRDCDAPRVSAVVLKSNIHGNEKEVSLSARYGVVVAAGALESPRLLHRTVVQHPQLFHPRLEEPCTALVRDALAFPTIIKSYGSFTTDACNTDNLWSRMQWMMFGSGPAMVPFAQTLATVPLPEFGTHAALRMLLLPFGGRDARRFYQMGWDRILGYFEHAVTVLVVVVGVDGQVMPLTLDDQGNTHSEGETVERHYLRTHQSRPLHPSSACALPQEVAQRLMAACMKGMELARRLAQSRPFADLLLETEALDFTLLEQDPQKARQLARLVRTPYARLDESMRKNLVELHDWASKLSKKEEYMKAYIGAHSYWLGFGSGSAEPFLSQAVEDAPDSPPSFLALGAANLVVGDASSSTHASFQRQCADELVAGSTATAIHSGYLAADELLRHVATDVASIKNEKK